jgi:hypothetical protein
MQDVKLILLSLAKCRNSSISLQQAEMVGRWDHKPIKSAVIELKNSGEFIKAVETKSFFLPVTRCPNMTAYLKRSKNREGVDSLDSEVAKWGTNFTDAIFSCCKDSETWNWWSET